MRHLLWRQNAAQRIYAFGAAFLVATGPTPAGLSKIWLSAQDQPKKLVDSAKQNFTYAYAPSIIYAGGTWHAYFCSSGTGPNDWDNIRYSTSLDRLHWSPPVKILGASDPVNERATCDPSVVRFDPGDGKNYYLFYTGNQTNVQGVNFVARSANPGGPFLKLTNRHTWEANPQDPKIILSPSHPAPEHSIWYGLGEPSVIARNGKLYQWYTDTTGEYPVRQTYRIYLSVSRDPTNWPNGQATNVVANDFPPSVDVKYDPRTHQFVMFGLGNQHGQATYLTVRISKDGTTWSNPKTIIPAGSMPAFAHNIGVSGSATGNLDRNFILVIYGAPYDLNPHYNNDCKVSGAPYCWGYWDLYGQQLKVTP